MKIIAVYKTNLQKTQTNMGHNKSEGCKFLAKFNLPFF